MNHPVVRHWSLVPPNGYLYLWMKYVTGCDLSRHCQESLVGLKSKRFSKGGKHGYADPAPIVLDETVAPFYYICGGSPDFDESKNLHIAFLHEPGSGFEVVTNREHWVLENARRIDILEEFCDENDPNYRDVKYRHCRNWQFAHYVKSRLEKEK